MKFYAVKKGRKTGIFTTWEQCHSSINGFSGAEYKSFKTEEDAKAYLCDSKKQEHVQTGTAIAYVDGSFNDTNNTVGCGGIVIYDGEHEFCEKRDTEELVAMRQIGGEIIAAMRAVSIAKKLGAKIIELRYDYIGIENWVTGAWKAKNQYALKYASWMQEQDIEIRFKKVQAHTDPGNIIADKLAKKATI